MSAISSKNILPSRTRSGMKSPLLILNMTEGTYFEYVGDYSKKLAGLFQKRTDGSPCGRVFYAEPVSRWKATDKIVFVPRHLNEYTKKTYQSTFSRQFFEKIRKE